MKLTILPFLCLLLLWGCRESQKKPGTASPSETPVANDRCDTNLDSTLHDLSSSFRPNSIDLEGSMSPALKNFIGSIDSSCLRKQDFYKQFIITIFSKFYLYHLKCCHQSYDLYSMKKPLERKLVREFEFTGGYSNSTYEMLSSGLVVTLIESDSVLGKKLDVKKILSEITGECELILADSSKYRKD